MATKASAAKAPAAKKPAPAKSKVIGDAKKDDKAAAATATTKPKASQNR